MDDKMEEEILFLWQQFQHFVSAILRLIHIILCDFLHFPEGRVQVATFSTTPGPPAAARTAQETARAQSGGSEGASRATGRPGGEADVAEELRRPRNGWGVGSSFRVMLDALDEESDDKMKNK